MPISQQLWRIEQALQPMTEPLARTLCEHRLVQAGRAAERAHGFVRRARLHNRPEQFLRHPPDQVFSGFRAAAAFGAHGALSLIRSDLPQAGFRVGNAAVDLLEACVWAPVVGTDVVLSMAQLWRGPTAAQQERHRRRRALIRAQTQNLLAPVRLALGVAGCLIGALPSCLEWLGGSAHMCQMGGQAVRHPHPWPLWHGLRDRGLLGWGQAQLSALSQHAAVQRRTGAAPVLLGAAITLGCLAVVARVGAAAIMGVVAGLGAVAAMAYEARARLAYHLDPDGYTLPHIVPLRDLDVQEPQRAAARPVNAFDALLLEQRRRFEDDAIERRRRAEEFEIEVARAQDAFLRAARQRRPIGAPVLALDGRLGRMRPDALPFGVRLPVPGLIVPQLAGGAARVGAGDGPERLPRAVNGNDVHSMGRDRAVRRCVAVLLRRFDAVDVNATLGDLRQFMRQHQDGQGPLTRQRHESGCSVLNAATRVLGADVPLGRMMSDALLHPQNTLSVCTGGFEIVSMARICAVIWHAIGTLQCPQGNPLGTDGVRTERKEAFLRAMSQCLITPHLFVCTAGQSQRLVMVLQGFVPGVQVEIFDAPASVAQFVTAQALKLQGQLGDDGPFPEDAVRRALDGVCLEGYAIYQGQQREDLEGQLRDLAWWTYDLPNWAPPRL
jgi:hypothetical protein